MEVINVSGKSLSVKNFISPTRSIPGNEILPMYLQLWLIVPGFGFCFQDLQNLNQFLFNFFSQTEALDDWLGPWISFLWLLFLIISAFSVRMIYKTFIKFRDTLTYRDTNEEYQFKGQSQIFQITFI